MGFKLKATKERFFNLLKGFRECASLSQREEGTFRDAEEQIEKMLFSP